MAESSANPPSQMSFFPSPSLETVFALNALLHPQKRPHLKAWAEGLEGRLTAAEDRRALTLLRRLPETLNLTDLAVKHRTFADPAALTLRVRTMRPDAFASLLLYEQVTPAEVSGLRSSPDGAKRMLQQFPWLLGGDGAAVTLVLQQPAALQAAFAHLLERVWKAGLEPDLPRLRGLWTATLDQARAEAAGKDPAAFARTVYSSKFGTRFGKDHVFPQFCFVPTYFLSPVRAAMTEYDIAVITLDCRLGPWAMAKAKARISEGLKALAEENRLEILRLLTLEPGFGSWVAGRLKLNPATVTHHLALLRKAGLVVEEAGPPGATKYYRTDRQAVQRLLQEISNYLDSNPTHEGVKGNGTSDSPGGA